MPVHSIDEIKKALPTKRSSRPRWQPHGRRSSGAREGPPTVSARTSRRAHARRRARSGHPLRARPSGPRPGRTFVRQKSRRRYERLGRYLRRRHRPLGVARLPRASSQSLRRAAGSDASERRAGHRTPVYITGRESGVEGESGNAVLFAAGENRWEFLQSHADSDRHGDEVEEGYAVSNECKKRPGFKRERKKVSRVSGLVEQEKTLFSGVILLVRAVRTEAGRGVSLFRWRLY